MVFFIIICLILLFWGFFIEPNIIVIKKYKLNNSEIKNLRIVFASDFHIAKKQKNRFKKIVKKINKLKPDIMLSAGDFVNGYSEKQTLPIKDIADGLSKIQTNYGFYTVLGNHDWWQNGAYIKSILEQNNINVLENESIKLNINKSQITIAGLEDLQTRLPNPNKALKHSTKTTILLTHNPDPFFSIEKEVYLTLAGHNHGGQVQIPFYGALIVPAKSGTKYANGFFKHNNNTLIVTKGLGDSIMNVRFCCVPEIIVIDFV